MPARRDTGGGGDIPTVAGQQYRQDVSGSRLCADPTQSLYSVAAANFNAATVVISLFVGESDIICRLKRISLDYDTTDAAATGVGAWPTITLGAPAFGVGGMAAVSTVALGNKKVTATTPHDKLEWDFGPNGQLLMRAPVPLTSGAWDGKVTLNFVGYAATDDIVVYVELEWWAV